MAAHGISLTQTVWLKGDVVRLRAVRACAVADTSAAEYCRKSSRSHENSAIHLRWSLACKWMRDAREMTALVPSLRFLVLEFMQL